VEQEEQAQQDVAAEAARCGGGDGEKLWSVLANAADCWLWTDPWFVTKLMF